MVMASIIQQPQVLPIVLCSVCSLDFSTGCLAHLASLFPFWSLRMVVAVTNLLAIATNEKKLIVQVIVVVTY
jgi:hypothetical protein